MCSVPVGKFRANMPYSFQHERAEAIALVRLVAGRWWAPALHHSPNEDLHKIKRQLAVAMGAKRGFPDYVLIVKSGPFVGCAVELKRPKPYGRKPTPEQATWLDHFERQGWQARVGYGADDALAILDAYIALGAKRPT